MPLCSKKTSLDIIEIKFHKKYQLQITNAFGIAHLHTYINHHFINQCNIMI